MEKSKKNWSGDTSPNDEHRFECLLFDFDDEASLLAEYNSRQSTWKLVKDIIFRHLVKIRKIS